MIETGVGFFGATVDVPVNRSSRLELIAGGTSLSGGVYHADVAVGHGVQQSRISGGAFGVSGAAAVIP
jgi:hypothetical protein